MIQVSATTEPFGLRQSFKALACLGKNVEIQVKDIKTTDTGLRLQLSDSSFVSSVDKKLFEANYLGVIQGKRKKGKNQSGFEVGIGSDAILIGWY